MTIHTDGAPTEVLRRLEVAAGFPVAAYLGGPENGSCVVLLHDTTVDAATYIPVCQRLHTARIRTVRVATSQRLSAKSVVGLLDALEVRGSMLVGDRAGAEIAWDLAATFPECFTGLVVIDCGHPRVTDATGVVRDEGCPEIHADTTVLVSNRTADGVARASRRYVRGDFRLTELAGWRGSRHFSAQLTTEILLRRNSWP